MDYNTFTNSHHSNKDFFDNHLMQRDSSNYGDNNYDNSNYEDYDHYVNHPGNGDYGNNSDYREYGYYDYGGFIGYDYPEDGATTTVNYVSKTCFILVKYLLAELLSINYDYIPTFLSQWRQLSYGYWHIFHI